MSAKDLLFELGTEELPPRTLPALSSALTAPGAKSMLLHDGRLPAAGAELTAEAGPFPGAKNVVPRYHGVMVETIVRKRGVSIALGAIGGRCGRESACPRSS